MPEREITISIKANNLTKTEFDKAKQSLLGLSDSAAKATQSSGGLGGALSGAAAGFGAFVAGSAVFSAVRAGLTSVVGGAIEMNATLEKSTLQFGTLMGDADQATAHVRSLFEFAKKTPFETGPIIEASLKLQTFGGAALNTMGNLTLLGDASAATGAPIEDLGFWVGRLYASLKGGQPFGESAMRLQELAVLTPQARAEMEAMQKAGKSGEEIFAVFQNRLGDFGGAMVAQASTWDGLKSSIVDAVNIMMADALHPLFELVKTGAAMTLEVLGSDGMAAAFEGAKSAISSAFGGGDDGGQGIVRAFLSTLLTGAELALGGVDLLYRGFAGLQTVFMATASVVSSLGLAFFSLVEGAARVATHIPGIGDSFKGLAGTLTSSREEMAAIQQSFHDQAAEAWEGVKGNSAFSQSIAAGTTMIGAMKAELSKVTIETDSHTAATKRATAGKDEYVAKTKAEEAAEKARATSLKKLNEQIQEFGRESMSLYEQINKGIFGKFTTELEDTVSLQGRSIAATGELRAELNAWAQENGAVLAPSIAAVGTTTEEAAERGKSAFAGLIPVGQQVATAINGTFAQMALGAKGFKDGISDIWDSIKAGAMRAFSDILGDFTNRLLKGMLGALSGQQGAFGQAFSGMFSGAGGSGGGGGLIGSVFGGGGAAGAGAGAGGGVGAAGAGAGAAGAGAGAAGGGGGAAAGGAGIGTVAAGVAGGAAIVGAGYGMGQLGQQIFGGAGWQAGTFGAAGGAATGALIGSVVPVIGTAVGAIVGGLVGMASGFIGVSKEVKISRQQVETFQVALRGTLTDQQRAEAGGEAWKETVIAVRDAYLATGRTAEEAEAMVLQMWNTDKPKEAEAAVRAIAAVMDEAAAKAAGVTDATDELTEAVEGTTDAAADLEDQMQAVKVADKTLAGVEALGASTDEVTIAQNRLQEAMSDVTVPGDPAEALDVIRAATRGVYDAARLGEQQFERMADAIEAIPREINVEVNGEYNPPDIGGTGPGYAVGTMGRHGSYYVNFGDGTRVRTHGYEAILTPEDAPGFVASYLERTGGLQMAPARGGAAPPTVYVLVEVDAAGRTQASRAISEQEYLRRQMQQLLRSNAVVVPQSAVVGSL